MEEQHKCEYYPCHNLEHMTCTFCFCPLYDEKDCGGNFIILENGLKDCKNCIAAHDPIEGLQFVSNYLDKKYRDNMEKE